MGKTKLIEQKMCYSSEEVWFPLSEDILAWEMDFHNLMLNDQIRMKAYEKAIKEVVKPGMKIVDLGTGTGILSLWALEAGASKVYGIDVNAEILKKADERIQQAGFSDRYQTINKLSYKAELPEKVDVIISEILGNLADNEDMTPIIDDARIRFLKKDGVILPRRVKTFIVPVSSTNAYDQLKKKQCKGVNSKYEIDDLMDKLQIDDQFNLYYDMIVPKQTYLSDPQVVCQFEFDGKDESQYELTRSYLVKNAGIFTGFKGYFVAQLSNNVVLDISGDDIENRDTSDCWKHCYLPVKKPFSVFKGDEIVSKYSRYYPSVRNSAFRQGYSWQGDVIRDKKVVYSFCQKTG